MQKSFPMLGLENGICFESRGEATPGIRTCALSKDSGQITKSTVFAADLNMGMFNAWLRKHYFLRQIEAGVYETLCSKLFDPNTACP